MKNKVGIAAYQSKALFLRAGDAHHKISILLKGHIAIYKLRCIPFIKLEKIHRFLSNNIYYTHLRFREIGSPLRNYLHFAITKLS